MIELNNLNIILTGATGVIGSSILEKLYKAKANIIASGTNQAKLDDLKKNYQNVIIKSLIYLIIKK